MDNKVVWVAENYDTGELLFVTNSFDYALTIFKNRGYLYDDLTTLENDKSLIEVYGKDWFNILKGLNESEFNDLFDWNIGLRKTNFIEA